MNINIFPKNRYVDRNYSRHINICLLTRHQYIRQWHFVRLFISLCCLKRIHGIHVSAGQRVWFGIYRKHEISFTSYIHMYTNYAHVKHILQVKIRVQKSNEKKKKSDEPTVSNYTYIFRAGHFIIISCAFFPRLVRKTFRQNRKAFFKFVFGRCRSHDTVDGVKVCVLIETFGRKCLHAPHSSTTAHTFLIFSVANAFFSFFRPNHPDRQF